MKIDLPTQGCNVFYGTYFDNYYNGVRTRYYLNDGQSIPSTSQTYINNPSNVYCLSSTQFQLWYKPELEVYFGAISLLICFLAFSIIYKTIIKRLLP